jgi:hypothetical protein
MQIIKNNAVALLQAEKVGNQPVKEIFILTINISTRHYTSNSPTHLKGFSHSSLKWEKWISRAPSKNTR